MIPLASELVGLRRRSAHLRVLSLEPPAESLRHVILGESRFGNRVVHDSQEFRSVVQEFRRQLIHANFVTAATIKAQQVAAEIGVPFTFIARRNRLLDTVGPREQARGSRSRPCCAIQRCGRGSGDRAAACAERAPSVTQRVNRPLAVGLCW